MRGMWGTVLHVLRCGLEAPFRSLIIGMFAAFAVSLPVTLLLYMLVKTNTAVIYVVAGAVQALATFAFAGWREQDRRSR